jgi:hypothetical protein
VDPALLPGLVITFLSASLVIVPIVVPGSEGFPSFELGLLGVLVGLCVLAPGIFVWSYHRHLYRYAGLWRFQVALSVTALELSNLGYNRVQSIVDTDCPMEYRLLTLFTGIGPGNLLRRMEGMHWDSEALDGMVRQSERAIQSMLGIVGALAFLGGLMGIPAVGLLWMISGGINVYLVAMVLFLNLLGLVLLVVARRKLRGLKEGAHGAGGDARMTEPNGYVSGECSVEDVLSVIRHGFPHPIRLLVVENYGMLEYTGRVYRTGDGIELREAYMAPSM